MEFKQSLYGVHMDSMWSMWSLSGVHMEYVESKWSPCGSVGECKIQVDCIFTETTGGMMLEVGCG